MRGWTVFRVAVEAGSGTQFVWWLLFGGSGVTAFLAGGAVRFWADQPLWIQLGVVVGTFVFLVGVIGTVLARRGRKAQEKARQERAAATAKAKAGAKASLTAYDRSRITVGKGRFRGARPVAEGRDDGRVHIEDLESDEEPPST